MTTWLRVIASRCRAVWTRQRLDRDFEDELRDHLESLTEEYEAAGMSGAEARRAAVLKLGHPLQLRETNRDDRGMPWFEGLAQDLGFALRTLRKSPGFAAVAILTMALGIGLCSSLFSFLNAFILRPLPGARDPGRLMALQSAVTYPYFESYRDGSRVASATAAFIGAVPFSVTVEGQSSSAAERISGHIVSLGIFFHFGRAADAWDSSSIPPPNRLGRAAVVVSERFWRMRLNSRPTRRRPYAAHQWASRHYCGRGGEGFSGSVSRQRSRHLCSGHSRSRDCAGIVRRRVA